MSEPQRGFGACIDYFAETDTVYLATYTKTGAQIVTPIWAVAVDGLAYIRNGSGERSKWYRRLQRDHRAVFVDGPRRIPVTIETVTDATVIKQVDRAYRAKYLRQVGPLLPLLMWRTRKYTMRAVPAD